MLKLATLVPPLKMTSLRTEDVAVLLVGISKVQSCQIAVMMPVRHSSLVVVSG